MRYAITHGLRHAGRDPGHTEAGFNQLDKLALPENIPLLVAGEGRRFEEMLLRFYQNKNLSPALPRYFTPFCGGAAGFDAPDDIVLVTGTRISLKDEYLGLANTPAFRAWEFVSLQPDGTLFLTGGEFLTALGVAKPAKGAIYRIDPAERLVELVHQG